MKFIDYFDKIKFNLISGFLAASSSSIVCQLLFQGKFGMQYDSKNEISFYLIKFLIIISSVLCNSIMLRYFFKSMQKLGTTTATVLNFCINFLLSVTFNLSQALLEIIIFNTHFKKEYYSGLCLMLIGVIIISKSNINN